MNEPIDESRDEEKKKKTHIGRDTQRPHGDTRTCTCGHDCRYTQRRCRGLGPIGQGVGGGGQDLFEGLVRGKVGSAPRTVAGKGSECPSEEGTNTTLGVKFGDDVKNTIVSLGSTLALYLDLRCQRDIQ